MEVQLQGSPSPSRSSSSSSSSSSSAAFWIPTIDLTDPQAAQKLSVVCQDHGFFYLDGHGIPPSQLDALFRQAKALFALPLSQKQKWTDPVLNRGYTALQEQTLDPKHQTEGDTKEGYYIGMEVPRDSQFYNPRKLSGPNTWPDPDVLPDFRTVLQEYHATATQIALRVVRLIAEGLGLSANHQWEADFDNPIATLRLVHYDSKVSDPDRGIFACGAHKDFGILTLLLTDHHPGLQVYHQHQWRDVPPKPHSFVVNVGDMLQIWTNGQYKSSLHRVLTKPRTSEHENEHENEHEHDDGEDRYSIPFFFEPTFDATLQCLDVCVDEDHPPKYKKTTCGEFLLSKFRNTHADFEQ